MKLWAHNQFSSLLLSLSSLNWKTPTLLTSCWSVYQLKIWWKCFCSILHGFEEGLFVHITLDQWRITLKLKYRHSKPLFIGRAWYLATPPPMTPHTGCSACSGSPADAWANHPVDQKHQEMFSVVWSECKVGWRTLRWLHTGSRVHRIGPPLL